MSDIYRDPNNDLNQNQKNIALCLSGGGFRATFFHFGVVKALADAGELKQVKHIVAVSGGSILAGHMIRNWDCYTGPNANIAQMEQELRNLASRGLRERVVRRYFLTGFGRFRRYIQQHIIQNEYARLLGKDTIADCYRNNPDRDRMPNVHFMCTNFNSGEVCSFTPDKFIIFRKPPNSLVEKDGQQKTISAELIPMAVSSDTIELSFAVAASSAFPGLFPPMRLDAAKLGATAQDFPVTVFLSDGGIYDNLGLEHYIEAVSGMEPETKSVIVSNASGSFQWNNNNEYYDLLSRNVRTVDILMDLMIEERWERAADRLKSKGIALRQADIRFTSWSSGAPPISVQQQIQNIRTDLDRFSEDEIDLLIEHGYRVATHQTKLIHPTNPPPPHTGPPKPEPPQKLDTLVKKAAKRKWRLFDRQDLLASLFVDFFFFALAASALMIVASPFVVHALWTENSKLSDKTEDLAQEKDRLATLSRELASQLAVVQRAQAAAPIAADNQKALLKTKQSLAYVDRILNLNNTEKRYPAAEGSFQAPPSPPTVAKSSYRVWLQFAGSFTRQEMSDFGKELVTLWPNAPGVTKGGERTENAAGLLEVRYGPKEDEAAAIALTLDILDLKIVPRMNTPRRVSIIPEGSLEIWISR